MCVINKKSINNLLIITTAYNTRSEWFNFNGNNWYIYMLNKLYSEIYRVIQIVLWLLRIQAIKKSLFTKKYIFRKMYDLTILWPSITVNISLSIDKKANIVFRTNYKLFVNVLLFLYILYVWTNFFSFSIFDQGKNRTTQIFNYIYYVYYLLFCLLSI